MFQNLIEQAQIECEERGPENLVKPSFRAPATVPFERGVRAAVPWSNSTKPGAPQFPGMRRYLTRTILRDRAKYGAIHGWRFGRRTPQNGQSTCSPRTSMTAPPSAKPLRTPCARAKSNPPPNQGVVKISPSNVPTPYAILFANVRRDLGRGDEAGSETGRGPDEQSPSRSARDLTIYKRQPNRS
jgi:hypothetical protein